MVIEEIISKILKDPEYLKFYEWTKAVQVDATFSLEHFTWERFQYWDELITELKRDNQYEKFDNKMQYMPTGASRVRIEDVGNWLLRQSKEIGIKNALEILNNYNTSETMKVYVIMTIMSNRPYSEYLFSNGVQILNQDKIGKINKKLSSDLLLDSISSTVPLPHIASIFAYSVKKKIKHENDVIDYEKDLDYSFALEKINNVKECLVLSRGLKGLHTMAHKYLVPDDIPLVSTGRGDAWGFETFYLPTYKEPFIEQSELDEANRLLDLYEALESKFKQSIKVSIERLNGYCSSSNYVERAVNIRTCMESVFLGDNELTELSRTLALRVSRLMKHTINERKDMYKLVKSAYGITSKAVHRGNIPDKELRNINILDEIAELCRRVIVSKIEMGYDFDWQDIELS